MARRVEPHVRALIRSHGVRERPPPAPGTVSLELVADGASPPRVEHRGVELPPGAARLEPKAGQSAPRWKTPPEIVVSTGVPFSSGVLPDVSLLWLRDRHGAEVPFHGRSLAIWPLDRSIRSVLLVFRARLRPGARAVYTLGYGAPPRGGERTSPPSRETSAPQALAQDLLAPNPDGPIVATLPPSWYASSEVSGPQLPAGEDHRFPGFESNIERGLAAMSPAYESYGVSCSGKHRTYYDGPHALYQRFLRNGDAARYRRARAEAVWYREHELRFSPDRAMALHVCQKADWTPREPLPWEVLRRMLGQGMLDDYLLTGDPGAKQALVGMGEAVRRNLPALTGGERDLLSATERNMAWAMMSLASYCAVDPRPEVRSALQELIDRTVAWQRRGTSGAFEHDLHRADPSECERGPRGGSPFMTALLVDALMDAAQLTGDGRVKEVVLRAAAWLEVSAMTSDKRAFRYLWGCETDPYDDSGTADLNLMIVPVFGAAYALSGDIHWLAVGDALADVGVREMNMRQPKHWNQAMRGFGRYLGYRAQAVVASNGATHERAVP